MLLRKWMMLDQEIFKCSISTWRKGLSNKISQEEEGEGKRKVKVDST